MKETWAGHGKVQRPARLDAGHFRRSVDWQLASRELVQSIAV